MAKGKRKKALMEHLMLGIGWIIKTLAINLFYIAKYTGKGIYFVGKSAYKGLRRNKSGSISISEFEEKSTSKKGMKDSESIYKKFNELKNLRGEFKSFENKLHNKSNIGIILGARGTGKSAVGMKLLENIIAKTGKNAYAIGFRESDLPSWINVVSEIKEVKNNSVLLIDESGISFSSRNSMSDRNKFLSEILFIARHKDMSVILISQNSSNIEINAIRQADFLILKPSSLMQLDFERKKIKDTYEEVSEHFEKFRDKKGLAYIYSDNYCGFIENSLPSFWTDNISKSFK